MMKRMTVADWILVLILTVCTAGSFFAVHLLASQGSAVIIESKGMVVYKGDLAEDRKITIRGDYGDVRIQIRGGKVAVTSAECPNKVCVRTGWRSLGGESIICVPNRVIVRILGSDGAPVRGVTG